jgi:hypothetical protein
MPIQPDNRSGHAENISGTQPFKISRKLQSQAVLEPKAHAVPIMAVVVYLES